MASSHQELNDKLPEHDQDDSSYRSSGSKTIGFLLLYGATLAILFHQSFMSMVDIWQRSDTFAHGFFIPVISLWLIWRQRQCFVRLQSKVAPIWLVPLLGGGCIWLLGGLASALVIEQLGVVLILIFGIVFLVGEAVGRRLAFPLLFLLLMVPMGEELIEPMMELTATSTVWLVRAVGIPVYREGLYFSLPSGNWSVVEACSGVRYLIASFALGILYAYITYKSFYKRGLFVLFSVIVPVIANSLRAFIIVMIGHYSDMTHAVGVDHLVYGWVFFGLVIFLMFWVGNFFAEEVDPEGTSDTPAENPILSSKWSPAVMIGPLVLISVIFVLSKTPSWLFPMNADSVDFEVEYTKIDLPEFMSDASDNDWRPSPVAPDYARKSHLLIDETALTFYQFHYLKRRDGGELVNSLDRWQGASDSSWRVLEKGDKQVSVKGEVRSIEYAVLSNDFENQLIWRWYRIDDFISSDPYATKIQQTLAILDPSVKLFARYYLAAPIRGSMEKVQADFSEFLVRVPQDDIQLLENHL